MAATLYWYDYETFGSDPARDRPAQFAGQRTDEALNPIGKPLQLYCRPADDFLPQPMACLLTGITPQLARERGVCEAEFIGRIQTEFSRPQTCVSGYNNIRFDDEVTRFTLYRNLYDPYEREWRHGNSRWDLIDVVRLTYALRPDGIVWPQRDDGAPSFRLEALTRANGIEHQGAHDALADVRATIALACLLRARQPGLYDYCFRHRRKTDLWPLIDLDHLQPLLHVSEKYPASRGCLAVVAPLGRDPNHPSGVVVWDLCADPEPLLSLSPQTLRQYLFMPSRELPEGIQRPALKTVRLNRAPVLVPVSAMRPGDAERLGIDLAACRRHLRLLRCHRHRIRALLPQVLSRSESDAAAINDPDLLLYRGGFFSDADRWRLAWIRRLDPQRLSRINPGFDDPRLPEMLFRYRARNWPESLNEAERRRWDRFRWRRLTCPESGASIVWDDFWTELRRLRSEAVQKNEVILQALADYANEILPRK